MNTSKTLALAIFAGSLALTPVYADQWDKKTIITIDAPMQIPTTTLQPGTYTIKLLESASNRHIVTVWDKDGMHLVTTLLAIPNYRIKPTGDSKFTMWETPANQPQALRAWFYPGDNFGQEFAYPKSKADEIAMVSKTEVPTLSGSDEASFGVSTKPATETAEPVTSAAVKPEPPAQVAAAVEPTPAPTPTPTPEPVAAAPAPSPAPESPAPVAASPAPEPQAPAAPAPAETPMPQTATNWHELMLVGLLTAAIGLSTFFGRKEQA
jgi:hypothetical protein